MGYLYVKVIESKKVAVRSSFFINYPFIRLRIGKEKKDTNFKPGVEWWDKIYNFKDIQPGSNLHLTVQARDKSIHVFGSDWLGEVKIKMEDLMDGNVHQMWFKLGKGNKNHTRSPRGYVHLAFQYFDSNPNGKRPFSTAPVEPVLLLEDWLAANQMSNDNSFFSSSTTAVNPSKSSTESERLRKSAPAILDDSPPENKKAHISSKAKSKSVNHMVETRPRSKTVPTASGLARSEDEESDSSYEEAEAVPTANLIDLSLFDEPKKKSTGIARTDTGLDIFNKESPVKFSPKAVLSHSASAPATANEDFLKKLNHDPTFDAWYSIPKDAHVSYNPKNPFLAMNDSQPPSFLVQN